MKTTSINEASIFETFANRLPKLEKQIEEKLALKRKTIEQDNELKNLIEEQRHIYNWFQSSAVY